MDFTELLKNDSARTGGSRFDIEPVILDHLSYLFGTSVIRKQRYRAIAVGQEIDGIADPHRIKVVGIISRYLSLDTRIREIDDPDGLGLAATVALPGALPLQVRHVGHTHAVRRIRAFLSSGQRDLRWKAARC